MKREDFVSYRQVEEFTLNFKKKRSDFFAKLEESAARRHIPIIQSDVADYLRFHLVLQKPKDILEIGTAIGYSALWMADALQGNCSIDSLEINEMAAEEARQNISDYGYEDRIRIFLGDAAQTLTKIQKNYDFVFIDAAKGHYREFWDLVAPKMNAGGVILCDNVFVRGLVCLPLSEVPRKHRTHTRNMKVFLEYLSQETKAETVILPVGDGLSISYMK